MLAHNEDWLINSSELAAHFTKNESSRGKLFIFPKAESTAEAGNVADSTLSALNADQRAIFDTCLKVMNNPVKVVHLHYNIADTRVSRSVLTTSTEYPDFWVSLGGSTDPLRLSTRSDGELRLLVTNVLSALQADIRATLLGCDLSTEAAIVFLAVLDQIRRSFLISMVRHLEPITIFSVDDIIDRLNESGEEDFRWALTFVDKLLPIPIKEWNVVKDPRPALLELVQAEIIEAIDEDGSSFGLTEAGYLLAETYRMAESRVVILTTYLTPDEEMIQEVFFLYRSAIDLILVQMSGAEASLVTMLPADLEKLLRYIFAVPFIDEDSETEQTTQEQMLPETPKQKEDLPPVDKNAAETGFPVPPVPPSLGSPTATQEQDWYISRGEEQFGPYSDADMIDFARQGNLHPEDLIWSMKTGDWVRADTIKGFFQ